VNTTNVPGFTAAASLGEYHYSFRTGDLFQDVSNTVLPQACNPACLRSCSSRCSRLTGRIRINCLAECRRDCCSPDPPSLSCATSTRTIDYQREICVIRTNTDCSRSAAYADCGDCFSGVKYCAVRPGNDGRLFPNVTWVTDTIFEFPCFV